MLQLLREGRIVQTAPGRVPRYKRYLDESRGVAIGESWHDIGPVTGQAKEHVGYPTQKPLALLERIIRASSNEGDMILDPFCGCATACVAGNRLGRQWIGIDLSLLAGQLVETRMQREGPLMFKAVRRSDIPQRTDVVSLPNYRTHKHTLFGRQEGICAGCRYNGSPGQLAATLRGVQLAQGDGDAGGIDSEVEVRGDTGGVGEIA